MVWQHSKNTGIKARLLENLSKTLVSNVNVLSYEVDGSFFRLFFASLPEGAALSGRKKIGRPVRLSPAFRLKRLV